MTKAFKGRRYRQIQAERVLGAAVVQAMNFFERFRSIEDLLPLFERLTRDKGDGWLDFAVMLNGRLQALPRGPGGARKAGG